MFDKPLQFARENPHIVAFLAKVIGIYAVWFVLYDLWLLPDGRLDAWLSVHIASVTAGVLGALGYAAVAAERIVTLPGVAGVEIANGCNGLSTVSLFVGFVLAFPGAWWKRLWFIPAGVGVIYLTNVFRCVSLLLLQKHLPSAFGAVHGFHALWIFYLVVFLLWVAWANYGAGGRLEPAPVRAASA